MFASRFNFFFSLTDKCVSKIQYIVLLVIFYFFNVVPVLTNYRITLGLLKFILRTIGGAYYNKNLPAINKCLLLYQFAMNKGYILMLFSDANVCSLLVLIT